MAKHFESKRSKKYRIAAWALLVLTVITVGCAVYVGDYYKADNGAIEAFAPMQRVSTETLDDGSVVFRPVQPAAGLIFYPGGKVEAAAYEPLMAACAERGILCVLVEMPFRLAVLDINAADGIQAQYPEIQRWYIGGHSLGGSMAASYLASHAEAFEGLILLGAYAATDLSETELEVLSIYGSEDRVMNREKYEENRSNLPVHFEEIVIDGGCHAYFGMYGAQDGDGTPAISNEEQIVLTAEGMAAMMQPSAAADVGAGYDISGAETYLQSVAEQAAELQRSLSQDPLNQLQLNETAAALYTLWDDALNYIWGELQRNLSEADFAALREEQLQWIADKERAVEAAGQLYVGGSIYPLIIHSEAARITEARVYVLYDLLKTMAG